MKILVISDIHANIHALNSILEDAGSYDFVVFAGDAVDYGPNPCEVIDWLKENADVWVLGNHDNAVAWNVNCGCGELTHELSVYTRNAISLKLLSDDELKFLRKLPMKREIKIDGLKLYIVHAAPYNPLHSYIYPWLSDEKIINLLREKSWSGRYRIINADVVILGHTHYPMKKKINDIFLINPGSVGQPRDGDNRASYGILDTEKLEFVIHRVKYDIDRVVESIRSLNLDKKYEIWLISLLKHADAKIAKKIAEKHNIMSENLVE